MIFVVVTMILVPATLRWHWWRFSARAFVYSMAATAAFIIFQKVALPNVSMVQSLGVNIAASLVISLSLGFLTKPPEIDILVKFYAHVNPFGLWKPVRDVAIERGLVKRGDITPYLDATNLFVVSAFQMSLAMIPFYAFLRDWNSCLLSAVVTLVLVCILYFTWYRVLPTRDEK
jgi:solute:Na+ symporter, SSS family